MQTQPAAVVPVQPPKAVPTAPTPIGILHSLIIDNHDDGSGLKLSSDDDTEDIEAPQTQEGESTDDDDPEVEPANNPPNAVLWTPMEI